MINLTTRNLEQLCDIKAHTLRIWESRYSILQPRIKKSNLRSYSIQGLKKLLSIVILNKNGYRISQIARMNAIEIEKKISQLQRKDEIQQKSINDLIIALLTMNADLIEEILFRCEKEWGLAETLNKVAFSFLERAECITYNGQYRELHFVLMPIRQKIILGIENISVSSRNAKKALFFLPQGIYDDLILLYASYRIKALGYRIIYMGSNISPETLKSVVKVKHPHLIFTFFPRKNKFSFQDLFPDFKKEFPEAEIFIIDFESLRPAVKMRDKATIIHPSVLSNGIQKEFSHSI